LEAILKIKKNCDDHDEDTKRLYESVGKDAPNPYCDKEGNPMSLWEWMNFNNDMSYKVIGKDDFGKIHVSTVWLGLNHNFEPFGKPLIFETMIFDENEQPGELNQYQERYCTEEEALDGHKIACKLAKDYWEKNYSCLGAKNLEA
jgi:hypothetical protein